MSQILTVQQRLAQRHEGGGKSKEDCAIARLTSYLVTAGKETACALACLNASAVSSWYAVVVDNHGVETVHNNLDGIQHAVGCAKPVAAFPSGPSVNLLNLRVVFVW